MLRHQQRPRLPGSLVDKQENKTKTRNLPKPNNTPPTDASWHPTWEEGCQMGGPPLTHSQVFDAHWGLRDSSCFHRDSFSFSGDSLRFYKDGHCRGLWGNLSFSRGQRLWASFIFPRGSLTHGLGGSFCFYKYGISRGHRTGFSLGLRVNFSFCRGSPSRGL